MSPPLKTHHHASRLSSSPSGPLNGFDRKGALHHAGSLGQQQQSSKSGTTVPSGNVSSRGGGGGHCQRQNPWQTQWINRSSEQTRDVFTCVWCKESFRSLQEMTVHMKESPRCGMAGMQQAAANAASVSTITSPAPSSGHGHAATASSLQQTSTSISRNGGSSSSVPERTPTGKEPMSSAVLAKNNVNLPRKLVRGQDVWLGRGAEQTRQILKCKCVSSLCGH